MHKTVAGVQLESERITFSLVSSIFYFHLMMSTFRKKTILGKIITYSSIGIQIGFTIGIGIIGGVYLDRWLDTEPWLTLLGLLIGVVSGFTRLYQIGKEFGNNHR